MAVGKIVILLVSAIVLADAYFVSPCKKCNHKDSECLKNYFRSVVWEVAKNGYPNLGIPKLDSVVIKNYAASVPGWLDLELVEGVGQGLRSCVVDKFWLDFDKRYGAVEVVCDGSINGHYKLYSNSSLIRNLLDGDLICGEGNGGVKVEKLKLSYDFLFNVERRGNDNFLNLNFENSKVGVEILQGISFTADTLYLGQLEASDLILGVVNQYWKMILKATGVPVLDGFFKYVFDLTQKYFNNVPVSDYIDDDVSYFISNKYY
ncbi:uncharacterized protein LOC115441960 [Manduca sexta]|uniref:uncharacterized protein LOC115441960 n=1 Tax=Manduca sexta TaxID=7130 RepID=UPI00189046BA|nr:uncharacterized protein LOC115441960 [Manduca sexta]